MRDRDAIIQRIKKLKAHAESATALGSLAEAEIFAKKITELLDEYNLSMFEIDQTATAEKDILKNFTYTESISYNSNIASRWLLDLLSCLCYFNYCNATITRKKRTFRIYGDFNNVDTVIWLYHYLAIGLDRLASETWKDNKEELDAEYTRYNFIAQFLIGAVQGLYTKLREQRDSAAASTLAVVKYNDKALELFRDTRIGKLKASRTRNERNIGVATGMGYEAGYNYNVGKPINAEKTLKKLG